MFATVIAAVDDSPVARGALRTAIGLARALDAKLLLVHSVEQPHPPGASASPGAAEELRRQERADGDELLARVAQEEGAPEDADRRLELGRASDRLLELAARSDRPLLVVGSRGRGAARAALLGSTSSALAANAPCPVLVVSASAGGAA